MNNVSDMRNFGHNKTVLITGINGYLASHIASQFLSHGFRVRGTVRARSKGDNIKQALETLHGPFRVEIVEVPDICAEGAFDEAVKGVHAICHTASILSFSSNPAEVILPVVASLHSILASASNPSLSSELRHFIYTSSSSAAIRASPTPPNTTPPHITSQTWNERDLSEAWLPESERTESHGWIVYGASKAAGEKALWEWVARREEEGKLGFSVNAVLPATCLGPVLCREEVSSTGAMVREVYSGRLSNVLGVCSQYFVSVQDTARLHLAPVLFFSSASPVLSRIFAWAAPFNWNDVLAILREIRPARTFEADVEDLGRDLSSVENDPAEALLKRMGRGGWVGLRECVEEGLGSLGL